MRAPAPTTPKGDDEPPGVVEEDPADNSGTPEQRPTARKRRRPTKTRPTTVHAVATAPRWTFELRSEASSAITKRSMALVAAFVDLQVPIVARRSERNAVIGPSSIGIGLRQSIPRTIGVPGGSTEFLWSAASLRVCPLRLRLLDDRLDLAPCVDGSVGMLRAESHGLPFAQQTRRHWLDGGASVLGVWHLPGPWVATAGLGMVVPLTRHRFEVVDLASLGAASGPRSELVSQAPRLGVTAGIGLGLEL